MNKQRNQAGNIIIGIIGLILVLIGLDMLSTNYSGKIISFFHDFSLETLFGQYSQNEEPFSPITQLIISPTDTLRPSITPQPTPTPTVKPPTATPAPTATPTPKPTIDMGWQACPGTYLSKLQVGDLAYVSYEPPLANRVRSSPYVDADVLGKIEPGEKVEIIKGPSCSHGWVWWKVSSLEQNLIGWTSEGDYKDYWLIKIDD